MIAMSGTIAVIFMGFGAFILSNTIFTKNFVYPLIATIVFMAEIILTFFTIKFALESYRLRNYYHPISFKVFFNDKKKDPDSKTMGLFINANTNEINEHFVEEYLKSIKSYEEQNKNQTKGINNAQISFMGSIIAIPIFGFVIILSKFLST